MPEKPPVDPPNPWPYYYTSDYMGRACSIVVTWNTNSRALVSMVVHRDVGCLFSEVLLGEEFDPRVARRIPSTIPEGDTTLNAQQLRGARLSTVDDLIAAGQITVGVLG